MNVKQMEQIVCYAMRYCIGRQTYAVTDFCNFFLEHLDEWSSYTLKQAIKDIDSALFLGDPRIDLPQWLSLRTKCYSLLVSKFDYNEPILRSLCIKKEYTGENLIENRIKNDD